MTTDTLIDIHKVVVEHLRSHAEIAPLVGTRVYARNYPQNVQLPAVRVEFPTFVIATPPAPRWWTYLGQVDAHADTHVAAMVLSREVQQALTEMEGLSHQDAVVQGVDAWSVQSGEDNEWTPSKPRWTVTVEITARAR